MTLENLIVDRNSVAWKDHPRFKGVQLKPLVTTDQNPHANINMVRVPPGCEISFHTHPGQIETIYVLAGVSTFTLGEEKQVFSAGQIIAVPIGNGHSLRNDGLEDVELLTVFTPPNS